MRERFAPIQAFTKFAWGCVALLLICHSEPVFAQANVDRLKPLAASTSGLSEKTAALQSQPIIVRPIQLPTHTFPRDTQLARLHAVVEEFTSPPDLTLVPRGEGARRGHIWIRTEQIPSYSYGLWVAGKVDGPPPDFAPTLDLLPSKDHIEIWLAASREVDLPEIGWNDHGQPVTLPQGAASCKDWADNINQEVERRGGSKNNPYLASLGSVEGLKECQAWAASQARYREYFKRLFVRQWMVGPNQQIETFATPASEHISDWYWNHTGPLPEPMSPPQQGMLDVHLFPETTTYAGEMASQIVAKIFPEATGYSFAVFIPFNAFPPLPSLETSELYVMVDVFNAAPQGKNMGAYSTSSPARVWGKPSTFNALRLDPPFSFPLTPCHLPFLEGTDAGDKDFMWIVPNTLRSSPDALSDTFKVVAEDESDWGNNYPLSPKLMTYHHFSRLFRPGPGKDSSLWVCGPNLAVGYFPVPGVAKGGQTKSYSDQVISEEGLDYKKMPDGRLLIKVGPAVGSVGQSHGNCGAAPKTDLRVFDLDQDLHLDTAIALGSVICGPSLLSQDFTVSPDWSQITEYDDNKTDDGSDSWTSTTYCLTSGEGSVDKLNRFIPGMYHYVGCSEKHNVQPPEPPVLKNLRQ